MSRTARLLLLANLGALLVLALLFPHLMIAPDRLLEGHRAFEVDCFACHTPFLGASSAKCISCHTVEGIGVTTTRGEPLALKKTRVPFHQKLLGRDCVACHSDHAGVAPFRSQGRFSHQLLDPTTRGGCVACHPLPGDPLHRLTGNGCSQCHGLEKWKPARFQHDLLPAAQRTGCAECHRGKTPDDPLHRQSTASCGQCHGVEQWKPSTFDHTRWFRFDRHHPSRCADCHPKGDYQRSTCYGCHEHSVAKIREEHLEEGIREYERCVLCHRSGDEEEAERLWKSGRWRLDPVTGAPLPGLEGKGAPRWDEEERHERRREGNHRRHREKDDDDDD